VGWDDCDKDPSNGCETPLNTLAHCGGCGKVCASPNAQVSCDDGTCKQRECNSGFGECNAGTPGCETALTTNLNCGECGRSCGVAAPLCDAKLGNCVSGCQANQIRCGDSCVDSETDANHCGGCNKVCDSSQGVSACTAGQCSIVSCVPGWDNCDGNATNGCEQQLNTLNNCKKCGSVCSTSNGSASCASGTCETAMCFAGHLDIDAKVTNGCEAFCVGGCAATCNVDCAVDDCKCRNGCPCVVEPKAGSSKTACEDDSYCRVEKSCAA
jgi:hypothetical protein